MLPEAAALAQQDWFVAVVDREAPCLSDPFYDPRVKTVLFGV